MFKMSDEKTVCGQLNYIIRDGYYIEEKVADIIFKLIIADQPIDFIIDNFLYNYYFNRKILLNKFYDKTIYEQHKKKLSKYFTFNFRFINAIYNKYFDLEIIYLLTQNLINLDQNLVEQTFLNRSFDKNIYEILFKSKYINENFKNQLIEKHIINKSDKISEFPYFIDYLNDNKYDLRSLLKNNLNPHIYINIVSRLDIWSLNSNPDATRYALKTWDMSSWKTYKCKFEYKQDDELDLTFINFCVKYKRFYWFNFFIKIIKLTDPIIKLILESQILEFVVEIADLISVKHPSVVKFLEIEKYKNLGKLFKQSTELHNSITENEIELIKLFLSENKEKDDILISTYEKCINLHNSKEIKLLFFDAINDKKKFFEIC